MKKKFIVTLGVMLSLIIIAGSSYAYYQINPIGESSDVEIVAKDLKVKYSDGPEINVDDFLPGGSVVKTFSIENEGTEDINYAINIEDITNDFIYKGDILITLTSNYVSGHIEDISFPSRNRTILKNLTITPNETHSYTMTIEFINDGDQSEDMNKTISGKVQVIENTNALKPCEMTNDVNGNGVADIGDEVTCDSESFYVYDNTGDNLKMLAKYNLYVGDEYSLSTGIRKQYQNFSGIQNSEMRGYIVNDDIRKGTTRFSVISNDYEGSDVKSYVEFYESYLNINLGVVNTAYLLSSNEANSLGCSPLSVCVNSPYSWLFTSSYWLSDGDNNDQHYFIRNNKQLFMTKYSYINNDGVRPVITIAKNLV